MVLCCGSGPHDWKHLRITCPYTADWRETFANVIGDSVAARDLRRVCQHVLRDPSCLPPVMVGCGVQIDMCAD